MRLKTRISLTIFVFSVIVAFIVGGVGHLINEKIEEDIWLHMLNSELEFQVRRTSHDRARDPEQLRNKAVLFEGDPLGGLESVPIALRTLPVGLHDELMFADKEVCALVKDIGSKRYFLIFDITELEEAEHRTDLVALFAVIFVLGIVVATSAYLGQWLTRPIYDLAGKVGGFSPSEKHEPLAQNYSDHEVKKIAEAIDAFFIRLASFIRREREFISMASHEFRTPLAVISGASDVLYALPEIPPKAVKPLERIKRVTEEMNEMVSVLLFLTKEELSITEPEKPQRLDIVLQGLIDTHRELIKSKDITLENDTLENTIVHAPPALLRVLASNLIRNAVQHMVSGTVVVRLKNGELRITDSGPGVPQSVQKRVNAPNLDPDPDPEFPKGLGLYIVRRITAAYGWDFRLSDAEGGGTIASIGFGEGGEAAL